MVIKDPGWPVLMARRNLNGTGRYLGKAFDDRLACVVLIESMRRLKALGHPNQVFFAAMMQEEIGSRGAHTAANAIKPDVGISIEAGITAQGHGRNPEETQGRLGAGPVVFLYDFGDLPNRRLVALISPASTLDSRGPS